MSTAPTATRQGNGHLSSGIDTGIICNYCKKTKAYQRGRMLKIEKERGLERNDGQPTKNGYLIPKVPDW